MKKIFLFILLFIFFLSSQAKCIYPIKLKHEGKIKILALINNNKTEPFTREIFSSLEKELSEKTSMDVDIRILSIDFAFLRNDEIAQIKHLIKEKRFRNADIIVVRDLTTEIKDFISAFDSVPVFVLANQMDSINIKSLPKYYTYFRGFNVNIKPTVDAAIQCCPKTRELVIISGASSKDMFWYRSALSLGKQYKNVKITNWHNRTLNKINEEIAKLPKRTAVIFASLTKDCQGNFVISKNILTKIKEFSSVPVFGIASTYLNGSIVGGYLHSANKEGLKGAYVINQWLNNKKIETPVIDSEFGQYMFDWNELKKWHIKERNLPSESIIINRPVSFVQRNSELMLIIIAFTVILSIVLFIILVVSEIKITAKKEYRLKLENKNKKLNIANNKLSIEKGKVEKANKLTHEFLHNMSHEIRTPMNGIIGFSDMLDDTGIDDDRRNRYISIIKSSGQQLLRVTDDILEISRLDTGKVPVFEGEVCLNYLITELFSVFNFKTKERNIAFYLKKGLPDKDSYILTDKVKLNKILSNLLENAIKFTNKGFVELGYYQENNNLVLYVKDTGVGISQENYKNIFDRFSQEEKELSQKAGGLGLGLTIVKENTNLIDGEIRLKSKKGEGTTFYITIPYKMVKTKTDETLEKNTAVNETIEKNNTRTILIAEDEKINVFYLKELIKHHDGFTLNTLIAGNGEEAVKLCRENNIDLILMDIKMPVMNGLEASKQIKSFNPDVSIIAQTAYSTSLDKVLAKESGCDGFISKPINKDEFYSLLKKYLR